jgi:hypothetical protein
MLPRHERNTDIDRLYGMNALFGGRRVALHKHHAAVQQAREAGEGGGGRH